MALRGKAGATLAGRYRLLEQLGEGGMGSVWKAEHLLLRSQVAVKIIDPDVARLEFNLARFLREAKTLATLRSPNVVQVLDFGSDADTPYLVMELLQGQTLGRRLTEQGRLSLEETRRVLHDVCAAMVLVHDQGLIHRDLKPDNIFLCNSAGHRVTKVVDFGIAKSMRPEMTSSMKTRTGHMLGTPSYMSPEQCRGLKDIDHRADLWALGVIAYECLVGKVPFEGAVLGDLLLRICMDPLPIPSERARAPLPPAFDAWFAKAVHRDREVRFQSARELATSLAELSPPSSAPPREVPEPSRPSLPRISFVPPAPLPRTATNTETNTSVGLVGSGRRGERRARVAAGAAAAIAMVFGIWALGRGRHAEVPVNVEVESLRPPYEVAPKIIHPRVPTGRRWLPSSALPSGSGAQPSGATELAGEGMAPAGEAQSAAAPALPPSEQAPSEQAAPEATPLPSAGPGAQSLAVIAQRTAGHHAFVANAPNALPLEATSNESAPNAAEGDRPAQGAVPPSGSSAGASAAGDASGAGAPSAPNGGVDAPAAGVPPSPATNPAAPRPSHGRQLSPSPAPLRGTAAPAPPSRAREAPPSGDGIRYTR